MGALRHEMDGILPPDAHHVINERQGLTVLAHRELYPKPKSRLVTQFDTRECLMDAVCDSSMFPFFTSNKVARAVRRRNEAHHRLVVDGIFAVSPERLGCPDFDEVEHDGRERYVIKRGKVEVGEKPERTVMVSCFPTELLSLSTNAKNDVIGSKLNLNNPIGHAASLVKMACLASSRKELVKLYERGWKDGEEWAKKEEQRKALAELQCVGG